MSFNLNHISKLEAITHLMGNGWMIDKRLLNESVKSVFFINKSNRDAKITIAFDGFNRWVIRSYIAGDRYKSHDMPINKITVNIDRPIKILAYEFKNRLLSNFADRYDNFIREEQLKNDKKNKRNLLIAAINKLVTTNETRNYYQYGCIGEFKTSISSGKIMEREGVFSIHLEKLSEKKLFEILSIIHDDGGV